MSAQAVRVARIDHDRVFWELGPPVPAGEVPAGAFVFGDPAIALPEGVIWIDRDCDLPGGRYCLAAPDAAHPVWHFEPLPPEQQKAEEGAPTLEQAVYDLITIGGDAPRAQAWAKWFESTLDERAKGAKK